MTFLDSNIFVYAVDKHDDGRRAKAKSILIEALAGNDYVISAQVLNEFSNVSLYKLNMVPDEVRQFVRTFSRIRTVVVEPAWTDRALTIKKQYGTQYYDSLLLAAAEANDCDEFLTEDLNDGQVYAGVKAVNPFKEK